MRSVQYGNSVIDYATDEREGLKSHYISVEKGVGVVLKGKPVSGNTADKLILKKARWILDKLELVKGENGDAIATGSRIPYLGKSYYVQVMVDANIKDVDVQFNYSKFIITIPNNQTNQNTITAALQEFYRTKAVEKITPRVKKLAAKTGLLYNSLQFRKMTKRWGSCTPVNNIIINTEAAKLPFSLIDYLVVHELVHTKIKSHSKAFWAELSNHKADWKVLDEKMKHMKL